LEALLARKKQFEGPKSYLECLGGAAGPKEMIRGNFDRKFPRRSKHYLLEEPHLKHSAKDRAIEKHCVYSGGARKRSTKILEGNSVKRPSECKGYIPSKELLLVFAL
jgi:hypothetical protein